jgi:hypothetical protein
MVKMAIDAAFWDLIPESLAVCHGESRPFTTLGNPICISRAECDNSRIFPLVNTDILRKYATRLPETRITIMRQHRLPSTRNRHLATLIALVAIVAATSIGLAHADTQAPAQTQTQRA